MVASITANVAAMSGVDVGKNVGCGMGTNVGCGVDVDANVGCGVGTNVGCGVGVGVGVDVAGRRRGVVTVVRRRRYSLLRLVVVGDRQYRADGGPIFYAVRRPSRHRQLPVRFVSVVVNGGDDTGSDARHHARRDGQRIAGYRDKFGVERRH